MRTVLHPYLSRIYPTNDIGLRYDRTNHPLFTDTLISGTTSKRGNKYAQVYGTSFGWAGAHPMKFKNKAHETFSVLFKRDGDPPEMVMDGSMEQNLGKFHHKFKVACWYKHQTEPYSPWSSAEKGTIREVKKGSYRMMFNNGTTKCLWYHSLYLEALIRSNTALGYHIIDGKVPVMLMTGQTADISRIREYTWFDWVIFRDRPHVLYPENIPVLSRYLGPTLDVGPAMCAKILKNNGKVVPISPLRNLAREEIDSPVHKEHRRCKNTGGLQAWAPTASAPQKQITTSSGTPP